MITGNFLNPIMSPLTAMNPALSLFLITVALAFLSILAYKYTTDQKALKKLREKTEKIQKRMKELQKEIGKNKNAQKEVTELNKEMLLISAEQMHHSMKSNLVTIIPFLLMFAWLGAHYAYQPLYPNQSFNITITSPKNITSLSIVAPNVSILNTSLSVSSSKGNIIYSKTFTLKAPAGTYNIVFKLGNVSFSKEIIVSNKSEYATPVEHYKDIGVDLKVSNKPLKFNILGFKMSWFWYYFIIMMIFNSLFRKLMKVY